LITECPYGGPIDCHHCNDKWECLIFIYSDEGIIKSKIRWLEGKGYSPDIIAEMLGLPLEGIDAHLKKD